MINSVFPECSIMIIGFIGIDISFGGMLGCGLAMYMGGGKLDTVWRLKCERRIAREDDPQEFHSEDIYNRWVQVMIKSVSSRLMIDSLSTNAKIFGKKATEVKLVLQTWEGCRELPCN